MAKSQVWSGSAWVDLYTLPTATSSALGGIKLGYTNSGKNYKVQVDGSGNAYVNVPWTNTINSAGSGNTSNKIFLVGTTTQNSSGQTTYSHDTVYVGTDGCVYSGGYKTMTQNDTPYTTTINYAQNLIINSNDKDFRDYWGKNVTFTNFSYPNYTVKQMVVDGESQPNDLDLVREYMKFMTGQAIIPRYVSNIPVDTFIYSNSTDQLWKMQYDDTNGLLAFLVEGISLTGGGSSGGGMDLLLSGVWDNICEVPSGSQYKGFIVCVNGYSDMDKSVVCPGLNGATVYYNDATSNGLVDYIMWHTESDGTTYIKNYATYWGVWGITEVWGIK